MTPMHIDKGAVKGVAKKYLLHFYDARAPAKSLRGLGFFESIKKNAKNTVLSR